MSSLSPNFGLVLATTSDNVNVVTHIAGNFSSLDSILAVCHTGSGQFRSGLTLVNPIVTSPTITGTVSGANMLSGSTGSFNTITATGGALTVNSFNIGGTMAFPTAIGSQSNILQVSGTSLIFAANTPNTGANQALSNLASVAINTSIGTFTGGFATLDRVIATSGALTGLTSFQATTGTFAGNVTISGTATINALNCTGGSITAATLAIGTWSLPSTIGSTGQIMRVVGGTAAFTSPAMTLQTGFNVLSASSGITIHTTAVTITFGTSIYDPGTNVVGGVFTAPTSGVYKFSFAFSYTKANTGSPVVTAGILIATTAYNLYSYSQTNPISTGAIYNISAVFINTVASGATVKVFGQLDADTGGIIVISTLAQNIGYFCGERLFEL